MFLLSGCMFFEIRLLENPFDSCHWKLTFWLTYGSYWFAIQLHFQGQIQGRNLIEFYKCLPYDQYVHLRKFAHEFNSFLGLPTLLQYLGLFDWTDIFKDEACEILQQTNFIWWTFNMLTYHRNSKLWTSASCIKQLWKSMFNVPVVRHRNLGINSHSPYFR